jgi:RNA polymerase sigma-70 factor, ECF subfamily
MPLEAMERAEAFARIRSTLEELPEGDRDLLTLRYALEYDAARIAELLGINATAVHMRLSRARQRLADRLTAQGTTAIP